ncbi:MAG TPA: hypothetical protein DIU48_07865, partial [Acidobacteria bacterium]|nr:hypothetical protein [Acidobacteriota bacterium]
SDQLTGLGYGTLGNRQWAFFGATVMSSITPTALLAVKTPMTEAAACTVRFYNDYRSESN